MRQYAKEIMKYYPKVMNDIVNRIVKQQHRERINLMKKFDGLGKGDVTEIVRKCAKQAELIIYRSM